MGGGAGAGGRRALPLLVELASDEVLPFLAALRAFRFRVLYGNVCNDLLVPYPTAMIAESNLPDWKTRSNVSNMYPHIIHDTQVEVDAWPSEEEQARLKKKSNDTWFGNDSKELVIAQMLSNLSRVGWRRISARFERTVQVGDKHRPLPGFLAGVGVNAHNCLPVCRYQPLNTHPPPRSQSRNPAPKLQTLHPEAKELRVRLVCRPLLDGGRGGGEGSVRHLCHLLVEHAQAIAPSSPLLAASSPLPHPAPQASPAPLPASTAAGAGDRSPTPAPPPPSSSQRQPPQQCAPGKATSRESPPHFGAWQAQGGAKRVSDSEHPKTRCTHGADCGGAP